MSCTISVVTEKEDIPLNPIDGKPTYVYWKILGLAQSARLALVAASVDFVDVQIDADKSKDGWIAAKGTPEMEKTLTFPNLPYFLHPDLGGRGIVQSDSILRFIGEKYNLLGASPTMTDMYLEHLHDAEVSIARLSYGSGAEKILAWYKRSMAGYLSPFGKLVSGEHKYLSGNDDAPGVADFKLYVLLYKLQVIQAQLGDDSTKSILQPPWIIEYMERIEAIPTIKAFMASPSYMKGPMNNPSALWRGM